MRLQPILMVSIALSPLACGQTVVIPGDNSGSSGHGSGGGAVGAVTSGDSTTSGGPGGAMIGAGGGGRNPDDSTITHPTCDAGACIDFPSKPILEPGVPPNAAALFGAPGNFAAGALCVLEPQLSAPGTEGAMLPASWLRPRFRVAATGLNLFEIRLHSAAEKNDLVVYTTQPSWYLPRDIWAGEASPGESKLAGSGFANNAAGAPITVIIRGIDTATPGMVPVGVKGDFNIAPVVATGSVVFWTVSSAAVTPDASKLLGFSVSDEGVAEALTLKDLKWNGQLDADGAVLRGANDNPAPAGFVNGQVRCMGCHTATPDGVSLMFTDDSPWSKGSAMITAGNVGLIPSYIAPGAQAIMKMPWWGSQTMAAAHFQPGDRIVVTSYGSVFDAAVGAGTPRTLPWEALPTYSPDARVKLHQLAWIDLEANPTIDVAFSSPVEQQYGDQQTKRNAAANAAKGTAWGLIATGDAGVSDVSPRFNHAGDRLVYTTTDYSPDGHPDAMATTADIKTVQYNYSFGGTSVPLEGASDKSFLEYDPSYSADDALIAFTRAPNKVTPMDDGPYSNRHGEVMVIPAGGGSAVSLAANTPNACAGDDVAKGVINSWPQWSPEAIHTGGKRYYFLIFSSARKYKDEFSAQFVVPSNPLSTFKGRHDSSQLYLASVVVDDVTGMITSYPAVYIWNQNRLLGGTAPSPSSNLTPTWDRLELPSPISPGGPGSP